MKVRNIRLLTLLLGVLFSLQSFAQKTDSALIAKSDSIQHQLDSNKLPSFAKADSMKAKTQSRLDSIRSLQSKINNPMDSLNTIQSRLESKLDSLSPQRKLDRYNRKLDSLQGKLSSRIDSLTKFNLSDNSMAKSLDSLRAKLDSLKTLGPLKDLQKADQRLADLQSGIATKIEKVEGKISSPLGKFAENGANIPGKVNLPGTDQLDQLPGVNLPGAEIPAGSVPQVGVNGLGGTGLDGIGNSSGLPQLPTDKLDVGNLKLEELGQLNKNLGSISDIGGDLKGYQNDLSAITELKDPEKLTSQIESRASGMEGVDGLEENMSQIGEIRKWQSDPDYLKEMAHTKLKKQSLNHFAGHEKELEAAVEQLSKLKTKYPRPEGALDLFAKHQNFVKEKTFRERLVYGMTLQVASNQNWWFDFNPYIGYQLHSRWTAGLGWNERLAVNFKERSTVPSDYVHGPRSYLEFKLKDNFFVKAEVEAMNTMVTDNLLINPEVLGREWVWSYFAGMKNMFNLSKRLKGHVQVLYNLFDPRKQSPYNSRFNIRFGIELPLKKKANH